MVTPEATFWRGRRVLLTGHTGFKGAWLALWLADLGAEVYGYALDPPTTPSLFEAARVRERLASDVRADLLDDRALAAAVRAAKPDVVMHLAAQSLVRESYREPLATIRTNVLGTAQLLDLLKGGPALQAVVVTTTDKVYENRESLHAYRESDALGGRDVYSASKAATEILCAAYRASFFASSDAPRIATARAGNVIGGGDWAVDRLIPDCLRAFDAGAPVELRYPNSVRPWQHVLEPLSGYLRLAELLLSPEGKRYANAWNFGPALEGDATAHALATAAATLWGPAARIVAATSTDNPHEAGLLRLDSTQARAQLGWRPRWSLSQTLEKTIAWHRQWKSGADMQQVSIQQIRDYCAHEQSTQR